MAPPGSDKPDVRAALTGSPLLTQSSMEDTGHSRSLGGPRTRQKLDGLRTSGRARGGAIGRSESAGAESRKEVTPAAYSAGPAPDMRHQRASPGPQPS